MPKENTVLIIEDDRQIADVIALNIGDLGLETDIAGDGPGGLAKALSGNYVLIILDIMLPGLDGLSVCRRLREKDKIIPILILTAKSSEFDRVLGLEIGADDYLTKPFSVRELAARVKALLRRAGTTRELDRPQEAEQIAFSCFFLDTVKHRFSMNGKPLELTVKEFDLLSLFLRNPGRTFSRTDLLKKIWGYQFTGYEHTVNTHINRLRQKIEADPGNPCFLKTVWGIGYRFAEEEELPE